MSILAAEIETETLSVENVSLYYGAAQALRGVSLQAPVGEVSAVMGRNSFAMCSFFPVSKLTELMRKWEWMCSRSVWVQTRTSYPS